MLDIYTILLLICSGAVIVLIGAIVGGWLMYKGRAEQGESFVGSSKGEVFNITDGLDEPAFPEKENERLLKRTGDFLKTLSGGKQ